MTTTNPSPQTAKSHSDEELQALQKWAHDKEYVQPGTNGTLPAMDAGGYGLAQLVWGGPMQQGGDDLPPLAAAAHGTSQTMDVKRESETGMREKGMEGKEKERKRDRLRRLLHMKKEKGAVNEGEVMGR